MHKFRLGVLLPEVLTQIKNESLRILEVEKVLDKASEQEKEAFFIACLNVIKRKWLGIEAPYSIKGLNFGVAGDHARYTEVLLETNAFALMLPYGIRVPVFEWNGEKVLASSIHESWACDEIESPLDGDGEEYELAEFHDTPAVRSPTRSDDEISLEDTNMNIGEQMMLSDIFREALLNNNSTSKLVN